MSRQHTSTARGTTTGNATASGIESYRDVVTRLSSAQKKRARGAPAYSVYVNRPLGRLFAAAAYRLGATPNTVSGISAVFTFSGVLLIAVLPPTAIAGVVIALLLVIGYAVDSADGQVARLRGGGTPAGEWLDHVLDSVKTSALHAAVLVAAFRGFHLPSSALLLIPLGFMVVAAVSFFTMILNDQLKARFATEPTAPTRDFAPLRSLLGVPTDYGLLCVTFVTFGWPPVFFTVYAVIFAAHLGYLTLALVKWFRDMRTLSAPAPATTADGRSPKRG